MRNWKKIKIALSNLLRNLGDFLCRALPQLFKRIFGFPVCHRVGFTLIEMLIVIGIIGVLAASAVTAVTYARERAKIARAQHDINELYKAITLLSDDTNKWPGGQVVNEVNTGADNEICDTDANSDSCTAKLSDDSSGVIDTDGSFAGWRGPYILKMPVDPWGYEYFLDTDYQINSSDEPCQCDNIGCVDAVVIGSYGPDGLGRPTGGGDAYGCNDIIKIITK